MYFHKVVNTHASCAYNGNTIPGDRRSLYWNGLGPMFYCTCIIFFIFYSTRCSPWKPHFSINSTELGTAVGVIRGPCCQCSGPCCADVEFEVCMNSIIVVTLGSVWIAGLCARSKYQGPLPLTPASDTQDTVGCNYLSVSLIPASDTQVLIDNETRETGVIKCTTGEDWSTLTEY